MDPEIIAKRILVCLLVPACLGCSDDSSDYVRASKSLAQSLLDEASQQAEHPGPDSADTIEAVSGTNVTACPEGGPPHGRQVLFLDATQSMAGFTGRSGTFTAFDRVLARLATELGIEEVALFGETGGSPDGLYQTVRFGRELHEPDSYDRLNNPDYCLVRDLLGSDSLGTSLYISDGVQSSEDYGISSPTVAAFREWIGGGRALEILAFRSEFSGRAWSEQRRRWIGEADIESRPFYVFIFARTSAEVSGLVAGLPEEIRDLATRISFHEDPVACSMNLGSSFYERDPDINWIHLRSLSGTSSSDDVIPGILRCRMDEAYPLASLVGDVDPSYYAWNGADNGFVGPSDPPGGTTLEVDSIGTDPGLVEIPIRAEWSLVHGIGFYRLKTSALPGGIRPTIRDLSTDSDSALEDFDRTFRFDWLIGHLVRAQLETQDLERSMFVLLEP